MKVSTTRVADEIVRFLVKFCSPKVFLLTGNGAMYLNDAMQIHPEIQYVCVRNESVAPVAASAYSQISGKVGTVCVTAGPGAANAMPGVVEAWVDGVNIFVLSGQVPYTEMKNYEPNSRTFGIAGLPIVDYVQTFTKLAICLNDSEELENVLEKILTSLMFDRPGPIWLDIPLDIQSAECRVIDLDSLAKKVKSKNIIKKVPKPLEFESEIFTDAFSSSKRPLFVIGTGSKKVIQNRSLIKWLEDSKAVFALTRPMACEVSLDFPGNMGVIGVRGRPWSKEILLKSDLIIGLGSRLPTSIVGPNYSYINESSQILLVNSNNSEIIRHKKRIINQSAISVEDFINNLEILDAIKLNNEISIWQLEAIQIKHKKRIIHKTERAKPLNIYWFCENLEKRLLSQHVVTSDAGSNYYACGQAMTFIKGNRELTSGTFAAMGISIPLAIGGSVALANKSRILCITGDGSIELNVQELQTISNYKFNIAIFVINNGGYASMRAWQDTFFNSRYIGSTDDTGTRPMNFEKLASAFDIEYLRISNSKDFDDKIESVINASNPILIEVICDPNQVLELPMSIDIV